MDEKLKALYESLSGEYELGSFDEFSIKMQDPQKRKALYDAASQSYDLGDFNEFESKIVKKKVSTKPSSKDSAFNWETGQVDVKKLSSTPPAAPTAAKSSDPALDSLRKTLADEQYRQDTSVETVQDFQSQTREQKALTSIRERRGTDYSSSAADMAKGRIDAAAKSSSTPLESLHSAASQMSFGDWLDESAPSYNTDQRTAAEFNAFSKSLSDENREIGLAIKGIESKMKLDYGMDMDDYGAMVSQFNAFQTNAKKLVDGFDKLPGNKKTQQEADRINAEVEKIQEQAAEVQGKLDEFSSTPEFDEISKLYDLSNINTKKYEDELKTGKYDHAQQFGKYLEYRQALKDESYKKMNSFEKAVSATGAVILHSLAKVPQSVASLTDVVEKSVGLEGEVKGAGDVLQDIFIGLGDDIQAAFPAPTKLQRGGFTNTAKWGDYQVDFTADGEIQAIRDKDGYLQKAMLSEQQEAEIMALKKERQFNSQSFFFQTASTITDVGIQILGTKGIGGIKAGFALTGGIVGDGISVGLKMAPLGTKFGATATVAGMMANDLYKEGLANFDGPDIEEKAARYALSTGVTIGLINSVLGLGVESQFLKMNGILSVPLAGLSKNVEKAIGQRATNIAKGILGEEAEEMVLEKIGQAGVQYMMNETSGGKFDIHPYKDVSAIMSEALTTAVAGGIFGGLRKIKEAPNAMQQSLLIDGSRNIPATIEAVRAIAEANGEPLTQEVEAELTRRLEITAGAISQTPEEHHGDMAVVGLVSEQVEIEEENKALQEKIKGLAPAFTATEQQKLEQNKARIEELSVEIAARIQGKDLFSAGGSFSNILGGSGVDSVPSNQRVVNGIEFVEYTNPKSGVIDVVMSGTSDTDYVGFYRIYENGRPTNRWSSKFENQSRNKENFKTMISGVQEMLPAGHEYTEKTSISTDGLRVWDQQLSRGYELQYDENGKLITSEVAINGDALVNELGIEVSPGEFENVRVTTNKQFSKAKKALIPYLEKFGLNESNIYWENGTIMIDLPVLKSVAKKTAQAQEFQQAASIQEPASQLELQAEQPISPTEPIASQMAQEAVTEVVAQDEGDTSSPSVVKRLRGFYRNSLPKMEGATEGQALLADIGKSDPQFYDRVSRSGNMQAIASEIDNDGLDIVLQRAMTDTGEVGGVQSARRVVTLIALGKSMAAAKNAGDTQALDAMRNSARELERLLGKKGTEFGQELSMYAIYSQTPEGQLAARLRDVEEKREAVRTRMTEGGRQVGDVVDSIVEDVAKEVGITREEAEAILAKTFGKQKTMSAAKNTIEKGKKEVREAREAIRNIMLGQANIGLPVAQYAKAGKQFIKLFSGYAKIYRGNLQKIRASFKKDVNDAGLNGAAAYKWLEDNHPEITTPIAEFHENMLNAIIGFYNGDLRMDLKTALERVGLTDAEATAVADDFAASWGAELVKKKESRLKQIVRTHVKSQKKARVIENGLLEAITIGGLNNDAIRQKLEEKYGIKSFTPEQIQELNEMVMDMRDMPSNGQKFKKMREMMDYIHLHEGVDKTSLIAATWYAKVLLSLKTLMSVAIGNEVNFWNTFVIHGLATDGGLYAMGESMKRLVQPITSKLGRTSDSQYERGLWFGLAEAKRFLLTGEASREMKKVARSADLELVAKMSFIQSTKDTLTSFANLSQAFKDVNDPETFMDKMDAVTTILSNIGTSSYMIAKTAFIPTARVLKYSLRAISAADTLRYYSMLDFTLDRKAYNAAVAEGLTGEAAKARAREIVGENIQASLDLMNQARAEFEKYASDRGQKFEDMFKDVDVAYRARELAEEKLDAAWRKILERDAVFMGQFDEAVALAMQQNPGMNQAQAERMVRKIRSRYYANQTSPSESAMFEAQKVTLQNDPQGVMGVIANKLGRDFPSMFDETINTPEPEPTGDKKADEFNRALWVGKITVGKALEVYSSFVFPFMKTMANVINQKMEHLPAIGVLLKGADAVVKAPSLDWNHEEQKRVFVARQIAGMMLLTSIGMYMKLRDEDDDEKLGFITMKGSKDKNIMQSEKELKKWKSESIVIGDKRVYYGDSPYAAVLGLLGRREDERVYAKESDEYDWSYSAMTMAMLGQMFTNASYLQTFSSMNTAMQEQDATKFAAALASPVSGITSGGIQRDLDRWFNPELRDRASIENRFFGEILARTPFAAEYLLDFRYNSLGETINPYENESWLTQAIGLDKYISTTEVKNPVFEVLHAKNVRFKGIGKAIDILGTEATYQEKRDYTLFVGRYRRKVLNENIGMMREMTTEQLELQLDKTDAEAKRAAELFVLLQRKDKTNPELGQTKDVSIETIDSFIREYDPDMVKEDSKMYFEELRTEKPEIEIDEDLFF